MDRPEPPTPPADADTGVTDATVRREIEAHGLAKHLRPVRRLYEWILGWAETRHAGKAMAALAYTEAIFFPVPADLLLGVLCLGRPKRSFTWAFICTFWSILGGTTAMLLGLTIGEARVVAAFESLGQGAKAQIALDTFGEWGFWAVAVAALTPVPYMVFSWVAGFAEVAVWQFLLASVLFRSLRFFAVGGVLYAFGPRAKRLIDKYFNLVTVVVMIAVLAAVLALRCTRTEHAPVAPAPTAAAARAGREGCGGSR